MKRIVGSGSEPRYLPVVSNTSCRGLLLYLFCASTPEAVPAIRTRAMAVFINMVVSCRGSLTPCWCAYLFRALQGLSESAGCIATFGTNASRSRRKARLIRIFWLLRAGAQGCFGHGTE